jgi:hypothetical protein
MQKLIPGGGNTEMSQSSAQRLLPGFGYTIPVSGGGGISVTGLLNSNYMVEYSMKKNVAGQSIGAQMITISDGSNFTGTVTAEVTIDNGTKTAGGGSVTHEGEGYHSYAPTQAETNGDHVAVSFAGTGALSQTVQVYTTFPQSVDNDTKISLISTVVPASLAQFNARSLLSANYALEVSLQTVDTNVDSILVDTNDLQTNQSDWLTATGFATTAEIADVPTVAEFNARTVVSADYFLVTDYTAPDNAGITQIQTDISNVPTVTEFNARTLPSADYSQFDFAVNEVSADIAKINGVTITGDGNANPFDV